MIPCKSKFPPGMVGVISSDTARFNEFSQALLRMYVPEGTVWNWIQGNGLALNRNVIVDKMLENTDPRCEWIWFIDDDHDFERDLLMQLLSRRVDLIQPFVSTRKPPFFSYTYQAIEGQSGYTTQPWAELPTSGLLECDAIGSGGMLIRRKVLEDIGYPWFEEGKTTAEAIGEDLYFCKKAKDKGYKCWIDLDHTMEHFSKYSVKPVLKEGKWFLEFNLGHGVAIHMPADFAMDLAVEDSALMDAERRYKYANPGA